MTLLPDDIEARVYLGLFVVLALVTVGALANWALDGKRVTDAIAARKAAEKHTVEETQRANIAEERLETLRRRNSDRLAQSITQHFRPVAPWVAPPAHKPDDTIVMPHNGSRRPVDGEAT